MTPDENPDVLYAHHASYALSLNGNSLVVHRESFTPRTPPGSPPPEEFSNSSSSSVPKSPQTTPPGTPPHANKAETRIVELPKFMSRRAELLEANKPVYNYYPTILQEYTSDDYLKHMAIFSKACKYT